MLTSKNSNPLHRLLGSTEVESADVQDRESESKDTEGAQTLQNRSSNVPNSGTESKENVNRDEFTDGNSNPPYLIGNTIKLDKTNMELTDRDHFSDETTGTVPNSASPLIENGSETFALLFETLTPAINQAKTFAEQWPSLYRTEIFRVALERLLSNDDVTEKGVRVGTGYRKTAEDPAATTRGIRVTTEALRQSGPLGPTEKLARALGIDTDAVERTVHINDGRVSILGRLEGRAKKELQTKYTLVHLYVKEIALGTRLVDVEELRTLCLDHGCYDASNFTGNYKKDVNAGLIREDGAKGARTRRYMLGQKGIVEGNALLRAMVDL